MKTTIIIAAILSFQASVIFAGNNTTCPSCILAPVTPVVAVFEETNATVTSTFNYTSLAPVAPEEADFSDVVPEKNIDLAVLAPVTPSEADFNDDTVNQSDDVSYLAPITPAEADFE
jgi:hypothetical protein